MFSQKEIEQKSVFENSKYFNLTPKLPEGLLELIRGMLCLFIFYSKDSQHFGKIQESRIQSCIIYLKNHPLRLLRMQYLRGITTSMDHTNLKVNEKCRSYTCQDNKYPIRDNIT